MSVDEDLVASGVPKPTSLFLVAEQRVREPGSETVFEKEEKSESGRSSKLYQRSLSLDQRQSLNGDP